MSVTAHDIVEYVTRITPEDMAWLEDIKQQVHEVMTSIKAPESTERTPVQSSIDSPATGKNACTNATEPGRWHLVIPGRMPSLNEYIDEERKNRFIAARLKQEKQYYCGLWIRKQLPGLHIDGQVYIRYHWYEPNRRRDKSNVSGYGRKIIEDALVERGVLKDDGWDEIAGFSDEFSVDKENPRIELDIELVKGDATCREIMTSDASDTPTTARAGRAKTTTTGKRRSSAVASGTVDPAPKREKPAKTTRRKKV